MTFLDEDYPGRGMLTKLSICALIAFSALIGVFWANNERLELLDEHQELVNDPDYPNPFLVEEASGKQQLADFYTTLTVILFLVALGAIGIVCYFALRLYALHGWQAEWQRVSYYVTILGVWVFAIVFIFVLLIIIGWLFEN
ncbi:MAG: hypothetical protein ACFFB3_20785 [Candidatus Hodarchaeota archaeon]